MMNLYSCICLVLFALLVLGNAASAQSTSAERKPVLEALRQHMQRDIGGKVTFTNVQYGYQNGWAFVSATPRRPGGRAGKAINWRKTRYAEAVREGIFDEGVIALLGKTGTTWSVVEYVVGPTDVPYGCWWKQHGAPKTIFPYTEDSCDY